MTNPTTTRPTCGPLFAAGLLLLVALFSMCARCYLHTDPTDQSDWEAAAHTAVDIAEPTDAIRVHPSWSDAPLPHLTEVGNLLHRHHRPLIEDLAHIQRLLIISEARRSDSAIDRLPFDADIDEVHSFDTVELLEVTIPAELRIDDDLTRHLADATVTVDTTSCRWAGDTWRCSDGDDTIEVRSELLEIEHDPRRCIRFDPPSGDSDLALETTVDDPGDILRIRAGLDERAARLQQGGDVIYRVDINGESVTEQRIDAHTSRWTAHDVAADQIDGDSVTLRVEVESVHPTPHHRRFCVNAWGLTAEQAEL